MLINKLIGYNITTQGMNNGSLIPNTPIVLSDTIIGGYEDATTITNWDLLAPYFPIDYLQLRTYISTSVMAIANVDFSGWNNLTSDEKIIACKYCVAPYALRVAAVGDDLDKENWLNLVIHSKKDRIQIIERMRQSVSENLRVGTMSKANIDLFYKDTFLNIEYYSASNSPLFKYWLNNTEGTEYENNGFAQTVYYDVNVKNQLNDILNGLY